MGLLKEDGGVGGYLLICLETSPCLDIKSLQGPKKKKDFYKTVSNSTRPKVWVNFREVVKLNIFSRKNKSF